MERRHYKIIIIVVSIALFVGYIVYNITLINSGNKYISTVFVVSIYASLHHIYILETKSFKTSHIIFKWVELLLIYIFIAIIPTTIKIYFTYDNDLLKNYDILASLIIFMTIILTILNKLIQRLLYGRIAVLDKNNKLNQINLVVSTIIMFIINGLIYYKVNLDQILASVYINRRCSQITNLAIESNDEQLCNKIAETYYISNYSIKYYNNDKEMYYNQRIVDTNACILSTLAIKNGDSSYCFTQKHNINILNKYGHSKIRDYISTKQCLNEVSKYRNDIKVLTIDKYNGSYEEVYEKYLRRLDK